MAEVPTQRIGIGQADILLAFDLVAALGAESAATLKRGKTAVVLNSEVTATAAFQFNRALIDQTALDQKLRSMAEPDAIVNMDASTLASVVLGDGVLTTSVLLGAASQAGKLPITPSTLEAAIKMNGVSVEANIRAFRLGRLAVHDRSRVDALLAPRRPVRTPEPANLSELIDFHSRRLIEYQGLTLAKRYRALLDRVQAREAQVVPGSEKIANTVARRYGILLAYKDEYEVARLLSSQALHEEIDRLFGSNAKLAFNMAPPLLARRGTNGRPVKREFSMRMRPLLAVLARFRWLRGTWADPFGWTSDRRLERALIQDYELLVDRVLAALTPLNIERASNLLDRIESVRGFGPVKEETARKYRLQMATGEGGN